MQIQTWHSDALADLPLATCAAMAQLFHDTIHQVNSRDYSPEQIAAWSPRVKLGEAWRDSAGSLLRNRLLPKQALYIASNQASGHNQPIGFAELDPADSNGQAHIDCFYVHHQWQGQGVGTALISALETDAKALGISLLYVEASITARPTDHRSPITDHPSPITR